MSFPVEMVVDRGVNGGEFLQSSRSSEPQHGALPPSERLMGVLGAIVQPAAGFLLVRVADDLHGSAVRSQFVGHDDMRPTKAMQQQRAIVCGMASLAVVRRSHTRRHATALVCA